MFYSLRFGRDLKVCKRKRKAAQWKIKHVGWTVRVKEEGDEREMMEGLKKEHRVTKVRNSIGNHVSMSWNGHET